VQELQVILHKLSEDIMFQDEKAESRARMQHLRDYLAKVSCAAMKSMLWEHTAAEMLA
jgi:hypothetical protein